jgi:ABC-2 type transport system permease protein
MPTDVARLDLRLRRRVLGAYTAGLVAYCLVIVVLYPAFKGDNSLDKLVTTNPTAAALFGVNGPISSSGGWLNANIYANFFPLIMLLVTIGYGAAAVAGQDEDGTLGLIVSLPISRATIVAEKAGAMAVQAGLLALAVAVTVLVGQAFDLSFSIAHLFCVSATVALLGIDLGLIAFAVGAATGRRGTAAGVASALAAAFYLVSSLAPAVSWVHSMRWVSLFYWAVGHNQISSGVTLHDWLVLVGVGALAAAAAVVSFRRLDVS